MLDGTRHLYPTTAHQDWVLFMTESDALAGRLAIGQPMHSNKVHAAVSDKGNVLLYDAMGYVNLAALSNFGPRGGEHAQHPPADDEHNIIPIDQGVGGSTK